MAYATNYPTSIPDYTDLPIVTDYTDYVLASDQNNPLAELLACLSALGTMPQGSATDLKDRLAQSLSDDGLLFPSAIWTDAPTMSTSVGTPGEIAYDATYLYLCYDTDNWNRQDISGW